MSPALRLLIIDDERGFRDLLEFELSGSGYVVDTAADAEEGLRRVREGGVDLVLCDLTMPGRDGFKTAGEIRAISPRTKVVLVTGYAAEGTSRFCCDVGIHGYLLKPFTMEDLHRAIGEAVGGGSVNDSRGEKS